MSFLFKKKKTPAPEEITTPAQVGARETLSRYARYGEAARAPEAYPGQLTTPLQPYEREVPGLLAGYMQREAPSLWGWTKEEATKPYAPTPYAGQLVAPFTPYEEKVPGIISEYMGRTPTEAWRMGGEEVRKTLLGEYDPYASPYYESLRRGVLEEGEESKIRMRQAAQIGGMLRSTGRLGQEADIETDIRTELGDIMARLSETERVRRLQAVPYAMEMGAYEEAAPLRTLEAVRQYTQRPEEQAMLERYYSEFARQQEVEERERARRLGILPFTAETARYEEAAPLRSLAAIQQFTQQPYYQSEIDRMYQEYQRQLMEEKYPLQYAERLAQPGMYQFYQPSYQKSPFQEYIMPLIQTAMMSMGGGGGFGGGGGGLSSGGAGLGGGGVGFA